MTGLCETEMKSTLTHTGAFLVPGRVPLLLTWLLCRHFLQGAGLPRKDSLGPWACSAKTSSCGVHVASFEACLMIHQELLGHGLGFCTGVNVELLACSWPAVIGFFPSTLPTSRSLNCI